MALQVWLPLNGDLRNQGLTSIEVTNNGTTIDNNGKIGKCYSFGANKYINLINYAPIFLTYNTFSLSVWFKCTAQNTSHTGSALISSGNWNAAANLLNLALGNFSSDHYTKLLISGSGGWGNGYSYNFYLNTWYHVVLTSGNGAMRAYVNGQLIGDSYAAFKPGSLEQNWVCIGNGTYSHGFHFYGLMNDVRIYDHCLSIKEVKELSKGLILHYKLDKPLHTNLLTIKPKSHNATAYNAYQLNLLENLQSGQTYTLQLWDVDVSHSAKTVAQTGVWVYWGGGSIHLFNWAGSSYFTNGHASYLVKTFTVTAANASGSGAANAWLNIYNSVSNASGTRNLTIGAWKLEKGSVATPFDVGINDPAYAIAGYSAGIEPDCSGYKRDGIITGTITGNIDTPRYRTSSNFPSGTNYINAGRGAMITDAITINLWVKYTTWGNPISCTESGGWNFESNSSGIRLPIYTVDNTYRVAQTNITPSSLVNNWHMLTGTYDGENVKIYIDGKEEGTLAASTSHKNIKYNANNVIFIGAEAGGNATTPASTAFIGNISDVRIYCTALSADDIKALYEDAGYIDNQGNFHAYEYSEF